MRFAAGVLLSGLAGAGHAQSDPHRTSAAHGRARATREAGFAVLHWLFRGLTLRSVDIDDPIGVDAIGDNADHDRRW